MILCKARDVWKILAVLGLWLQHCQCQSDAPSVENYGWRTLHSVATLGNYLYIDGGQVSQLLDGTNDTTGLLTNNSTLSIALDQPWTPSNVSISIINKRSAPLVKTPALWSDANKSVIYSWGGEGFGKPPSPVYLWQFTPDGKGKGSWATDGTPGDGTRSGTAGSAVVCNGRGFLLGGHGTGWTDPSYGRLKDDALQPGMLIYDFVVTNWRNDTTVPAPYSPHRQGQGACLTFGDEGLVTFLGGTQTDGSTAQDWVPFDNLTFYDPKTQKWLSQTTRGDIPETRRRFCAVGAGRPNGTYEIFIYGGNTVSGDVFSDVYILSIPAFQWFRASTDSRQVRLDHRCAVAGSRHMISVGGMMQRDGAQGNDRQAAQDPRKQGIGLFDMSELAWIEEYNPEAPVYEPATIIKNWYASNDLASVPWNNDQVKGYFIKGTSTGSTAPQETTHASKSTPVGAIAGGVVGGVAALVAFVGGAWLWYRRRVKRPRLSELGTQPSGYEQVQKPESELSPDTYRQEMPVPMEEPNSKFLTASPPLELPAPNSYYELPQSEEDRSRYN